MKALLLIVATTLSLSAFAANYVPVPDGSYSGAGSWTDNLGNQGTWSMNDIVSQNGGHHQFSAQFSDGRAFAGDVDVKFSANSHYTFIANVGGHSVKIGQGVSSPVAYQNALALSAVDTINELGEFRAGKWHRHGTIVDSQTGLSTFVTITLQ